jgi:hypothetical protein
MATCLGGAGRRRWRAPGVALLPDVIPAAGLVPALRRTEPPAARHSCPHIRGGGHHRAQIEAICAREPHLRSQYLTGAYSAFGVQFRLQQGIELPHCAIPGLPGSLAVCR